MEVAGPVGPEPVGPNKKPVVPNKKEPLQAKRAVAEELTACEISALFQAKYGRALAEQELQAGWVDDFAYGQGSASSAADQARGSTAGLSDQRTAMMQMLQALTWKEVRKRS